MKSKTKIFSALSGIVLIVIMLAFSPPAAADETPFHLPDECGLPDGWTCIAEPKDDPTVLILKPDNFNGTLIMYAHGYVLPQEDLALPVDELEGFIDPLYFLVSKGFAFATTSYSKNGYAVEQGGEDLKALAKYFNNKVSETSRILLIGASEGASIIQMLIEGENGDDGEEDEPSFDGGLAMCGPVAGMPYQINKVGDFFVIFDYLFPEVFGGRLSLSDPIPDDFAHVQRNWEISEDDLPPYEDAIARAIETHPLKTLRLFGITDTAFNWFDRDSFVDAAHLQLGRTVFGTLDMVETASGMPFDNRDTWYDASWRLNRKVERVKGDGAAMDYVEEFYQPTGVLNKPLVTMHNWNDPNVSFEHEELYAQLVNASGHGDNLTVLPIPGFGHCNFKPWQVLGAFFLLLDKVDFDLNTLR